MRHLKAGRKLNRDSAERRALFRNMVTALFRHGRITTTLAKAKELRGVAERLITVAKRGIGRAEDKGDAAILAARRRARRWINDREVLHKLFEDLADRYSERAGGYTRIVKVQNRFGDNAPMAIIEMVPDERKSALPPSAEKPVKGKKAAEPPPEAEAAAEKKPARGRKRAAAAAEKGEPEKKPARGKKKAAEEAPKSKARGKKAKADEEDEE
jgi:large subunit ribosomal protein L17